MVRRFLEVDLSELVERVPDKTSQGYYEGDGEMLELFEEATTSFKVIKFLLALHYCVTLAY